MAKFITAKQAAQMIKAAPHEIKGLIRFKQLNAQKFGVGYMISEDEFKKLCKKHDVEIYAEHSEQY